VHKFILELRRREVFRTAGLYVGVCWIAIEAASILLPTFGAPEWMLRGLVIIAMIGFPVMLVLAWVYDVSDQGVTVQADAIETVVVPFGGRKTDFVVIGVLSVALIFSLYMNFRAAPPAASVDLQPLSVLIADFDNLTGQPLFDGLLEQALNIGIESAPHLTSYQRNAARELAQKLRPDSTALDSATAALIAVREGIGLVISGKIEPSGTGFQLRVEGNEPIDGRQVFAISESADSSESVLSAVGNLSAAIREELGDTSIGDSKGAVAETFTAASIEAARAYMNGIEQAYAGDHESAVGSYSKAIELDPNFGRAFAGLALTTSRLGRNAQAKEHWKKALSLLDTMTERERLRTLGVYYTSITRNYSSAVSSFRTLVEKFPADAAGHNNLAVVYFLTLDFASARTEGRALLDIYPNSQLYRSNYALYAMYAGDFAEAKREAEAVVEQGSSFYKGYLPQAIAALDAGDFDAARAAYDAMATTGPRGASLANAGLADIAMYAGEFAAAAEILQRGIESDLGDNNVASAAAKYVVLAESLLETGSPDAAGDLRRALELDGGEATTVSAALTYHRSGASEIAQEIAGGLAAELSPQRRAYGLMLRSLQDGAAGLHVEAVDKLSAALELADLWLLRFELGKAYLNAGYAAEALAEFEAAHARRGEAAAIFLDDVPTFRYLATLPFWIAQAQLELGMSEAARRNLAAFLERRPGGGALADKARALLD
jgi:tetratricopeptide (TPR) repeat protein